MVATQPQANKTVKAAPGNRNRERLGIALE
jgi:hypothetical protein